MTLSAINVTCKKCDSKFTGVPKRTFIGFQKLVCPTCQEKLTYPLTSGYRATYWVLLVVMISNTFVAISQGGFAVPGIIGIAVIFALIRDRNIRKQVSMKVTYD
jgi:hypothetical protein